MTLAKRLVVGSGWKMNKTRAEARDFVRRLRQSLAGYDDRLVRAYILPPFTALAAVGQELADYPMELGAQNVHWEDAGAYTGEISPLMLKELGCTIVMIGHSERRLLFCETDEIIGQKVLAAYRHGLAPLLCVGETREEWLAAQTAEVLRRQLGMALRGIPPDFMRQLLVLYEPRWAIGQKEAAPPDYVQATHALARDIVGQIYGAETAAQANIVYGGSVNLANLADILRLPDVDGCAIGRAAWDPESFAAMVRLAEEIARERENSAS